MALPAHTSEAKVASPLRLVPASGTPRAPLFLTRSQAPALRAPAFLRPPPLAEAPAFLAPRPGTVEAPAVVAVVPPPVAAAPPLPEPRPEVDLGQLADAVRALREKGVALEQHVSQAALDVAFQLARRILELEIQTRPEALSALVRSALSRLGAASQVKVRLCPADAERLEATGGAGSWAGLPLGEVELVADDALGPGDCVVESDLARVDGRIETRLATLQAALAPDGLVAP
jgi:hypothetical protein